MWFVMFNTEIIQLLLFQQNRAINTESIEGCISDKSSWNETVDQLSSDTSEKAGRPDVVTELVINTTIDLAHVIDAF